MDHFLSRRLAVASKILIDFIIDYNRLHFRARSDRLSSDDDNHREAVRVSVIRAGYIRTFNYTRKNNAERCYVLPRS